MTAASKPSTATEMTVDTLAGQWLDALPVTDNTRHLYRLVLTQHLLPAFGTLTLQEATTARLGVYLARMQATKPALARECLKLLSSMFALAVRKGILTANPAHSVHLAPVIRRRRTRNRRPMGEN